MLIGTSPTATFDAGTRSPGAGRATGTNGPLSPFGDVPSRCAAHTLAVGLTLTPGALCADRKNRSLPIPCKLLERRYFCRKLGSAPQALVFLRRDGREGFHKRLSRSFRNEHQDIHVGGAGSDRFAGRRMRPTKYVDQSKARSIGAEDRRRNPGAEEC